MKSFRLIQFGLVFAIISLYSVISCKKVTIPEIRTHRLDSITYNGALSGGDVISDGGAAVISRGVCWSTIENPTIFTDKTSNGSGTGTFESYLTGLIPDNKYFVRAYATNSAGTGYGTCYSFTSDTVQYAYTTITKIKYISVTSVEFQCNTPSSGGGTVTGRGVHLGLSVQEYPDDLWFNEGAGTGVFRCQVNGLLPNTKYYAEAYGTNEKGVCRGGPQVSFTTLNRVQPIQWANLNYGTVNDIDGNIYKTISIGNQIWMAENLKTTYLNDNTPIENVTDPEKWFEVNSASYCWYQNDSSSFKEAYGALYNWYAIGTGKLCPTGWHVPSNEEWSNLEKHFGSNYIAAYSLKEYKDIHWRKSNYMGTGSSGFAALPGADRNKYSDFGDSLGIGLYGKWWSTSSNSDGQYYARELPFFQNIFIESYYPPNFGLSIRCLKDN